ANAIGIFGSWSDTGKGSGGISLTTSQGLQIAGTVSSPGPVTLNSGGDLAVNAGISSVGTVDLESGGAITQTAGISAATLTGSAGNGVSLGTVANAVGVFGPFRNTGSGSLTFKGSSDGILTIA